MCGGLVVGDDEPVVLAELAQHVGGHQGHAGGGVSAELVDLGEGGAVHVAGLVLCAEELGDVADGGEVS